LSPRFWRRAPRTATTPTVPGPRTWWGGLASAPAISALLDLAGQEASGVLEFPADPGGAVYLVEGLVSQVVSPDVPGVAERVIRLRPDADQVPEEAIHGLPAVQVRALLADAAADAALDIFGGADAGRSITRFTPDRRHWAPLTRPLEVSRLLDEIARRRRVLAAIAGRSRPDEQVTRAEHLPVQRIRLTARQWDLVRLADGRRTPRALARTLGSGVFATTVDVAELVQAGLLAPVTGDVRTPMPFLQAVSGA
jgi:hypothetical protein